MVKNCFFILLLSHIVDTGKVRNTEPIYALDMAEDSVDDCYLTCSKRMFKLVSTKILDEEIKKQNDFRRAWNNAKNKKKPPSQGYLKEEHIIAILTYTQGGNQYFYDKFNKATRTGLQQYTNGKFQYMSLHFLLSDAISLIKDNDGSPCLKVYRRTKVMFEGTHIGAMVRLGSFTSTSLLKGGIWNFGNVTCFVITTCLGAKVANYSALPHEKEVLIPPYEKFIIQKNKEEEEKILNCKVVYTLQSEGLYSNQVCTLLNKISSQSNLPKHRAPPGGKYG